ncbi:hypothetical protein COS93_01445 [bacterium (Candidatus Gribaldobacteria) CG07_land_8_20_14_0_80_33_18]|uniref:Prepilin-type N-terminal cleavage/methylation domain-containing protein n=1 Tax=bacterium (Candidatus Gribaldobacteria) CG07_land_8_20_14_0_80_33_18 TaxID=2014272 RepID=A0A2M6Z3B5_9BACT|nr:MAG: hypothetical protein COU04_01195 [bacterium (Candidatus Gribaldobacteria) CG10_big_fil_rev_8_21_14_0_10_33_41]PIU46901.1 MAG: hypothetical protein COS93_01445 [bacterium (Candidatus Gribaldobacteria) CG07_land_8_20_14_0_80_33_18]PJA01120.1 MAG: hypothetical protein COX75_00595 [bacterium (Candidatus Gribaldobacteria) CG_4_10_14_0_2_um_filter_33_15]
MIGNKTKGFTLIEILIAMSLLAVIITGAVNLFTSVIKEQRKVLALQTISSNASYTLEYISRVLRMAKKDMNGDCISKYNNFENPDAEESKIIFLDYHEKCHEFIWDNNQIKERKSFDKTAGNLGEAVPLTPDNLEISNLKFEIEGANQNDEIQPRVTMAFTITTKQPLEKQEMKLQATISQRDLDVQY